MRGNQWVAKMARFVIPAEAGIQIAQRRWTPAFAGVTAFLPWACGFNENASKSRQIPFASSLIVARYRPENNW
jgi:hypothetical protein